MSNDLTLLPDIARQLRAGLNRVLYDGTDSNMRDSAVLAAQEHVINTIKALGKSADDALTVFGLIRAKRPRTHAELGLVCQIIIAEDRALKNARLARLLEAAGDLKAALAHDTESRKSGALALRHGRAIMRARRQAAKMHRNPVVKSGVLFNSRWR